MAESTKSSTIHLPLKLAFTENGSHYVLKNKKELSRLELVDKSDEHGIEVSQFSPALLQRLIILDYVAKLETSNIHHNDNRSELVDFSKLIVFSKLYQQFNSEVLTRLLASDSITRHNRANPGKCLDEKAVVDDSKFEEYLKKQTETKQRIFKLILNPIHEGIIRNTKYSASEKKLFMLMTEKFLNKMSYYIWYLLLLFSNDVGFPQLITIIRLILTEYMPKTSIAEYVAFIVLELCTSMELSNLEYEAKKLYGENDFKKSMLLDPIIRNKLYDTLRKKDQNIFVSWKIGGSSTAIGKENILKISVYSKTFDYLETRENIIDKMSFNIKKFSLLDAFKNLPKGYFGNDMGLYYIAYLDDACKQVNVKFSVNVNRLIANELTFIDLNFKF